MNYHQTGHPYPAQAGTDVVPDPDAPTSDLLTHSQLQEEERDADDEEEDEVGNQVGAWKTGGLVKLMLYKANVSICTISTKMETQTETQGSHMFG